MTKDYKKNLCLESYLTGEKDLLEVMIIATRKTKAIGQVYVSFDDVLAVYKNMLEQVNDKLKLVKENYK